jgi:hypothetical protein
MNKDRRNKLMNDESSRNIGDFAAHEIEPPAENNSPQSEGAFDPKVQILLDQADQLLTTQIDPVMREAFAADPEKLAEWDALMQEYAQIAAEDQAPPTESETRSEREIEEARLSEDIRERMDMISSDLDRFMDRQPPDLEVDVALERNFAAMHEVDALMRQRCLDFPAQLAEWEAVMEYLEEVERRFAIGLEAENAEPEN